MSNATGVVVAGGGVFGVTAALELRARGHDVTVVDPGPIPHPLAASTDISKVIRMEYGADEDYMAMVEASLPGWRAWNEEFGAPLYHETGVLMITREPMSPGGFEYESYRLLLRRGHRPERLGDGEIARRFPAWGEGVYVDGFFHARGGFAESGRVVAALAARAEKNGVRLVGGVALQGLRVLEGRALGLRLADGTRVDAEHVIIAAGAWTPLLVPELASFMHASGHPVFHLAPRDPALFTPPAFVTFTADVARTGWYGFPLHPAEGVVKIASHGGGRRIHPDEPRVVSAADERMLRAMLAVSLPALRDAPIVRTRRCLYSDTLDGHLWIDRHPGIRGLTVASGDSGHAFKLAPILGELIADAVEGNPNRWLPRFRWRQLPPDTRAEEAARFHPPGAAAG